MKRFYEMELNDKCFQNYIQHNKDWNDWQRSATQQTKRLPELHPAQQGLKLMKRKHISHLFRYFQNYIQHNKDWNEIALDRDVLRTPTSRTTSSTTRIEIIPISYRTHVAIFFQNYIQHNKDWNNDKGLTDHGTSVFQNYIQHNKDWNLEQYVKENTVIILPELHPAQQGLKSLNEFHRVLSEFLPELHPAQQGLKLHVSYVTYRKNRNFQNYIQHNKDWNYMSAT